MSSTNNPGRVAGFLYLLLLAAPLRLIYIPGKLFVHGNATATANNIAAHESLFRFGIAGDLFTGTMVIFVALALLFLRLHHQEVVAAEIFWGLWLFPLGVLAYRSRFLPRFLGVWLIINGFAYLAMSFTGLLLPQYEDMVSNISFPAQLGELAFMLWLVIKGARPPALPAPASSPAAG